MGGAQDPLHELALFIVEAFVKALAQQLGETVDGTQRCFQVVRNRIGERIQFCVELLQFDGPGANPLFQGFVEVLHLPVALEPQQLGVGTARADGQECRRLHMVGQRLMPERDQHPDGLAGIVVQALAHVGLEAPSRQRKVVGEQHIDMIGVDAQALLTRSHLAGCALQSVCDIGRRPTARPDGQRVHHPAIVQLAHRHQVGAHRLGHGLNQLGEEGVPCVACHAVRQIEQLRFPAFFFVNIHDAGQHAGHIVKVNLLGPDLGVQGGAIGPEEDRSVAMQVAQGCQAFHDTLAVLGSEPRAELCCWPADTFRGVGCTGRSICPAHLDDHIVFQAGDHQMKWAEVEGFGKAFFGSAEAAQGLVLFRGVEDGGDHQLVFSVQPQLAGNMPLETLTVGTQADGS